MKKLRITASVVLAVALVAGVSAWAAQRVPTGPRNDHLRHLTDEKVLIRVDGKAFVVTLYDNETAKDLLTRLPLALKANDYAGYEEKIMRLGTALSMKGAPKGDNPEIPEVGYYKPGNWIALYYGPIGYWAGKVPLGKIDATPAELEAIADNSSVTIERAPSK